MCMTVLTLTVSAQFSATPAFPGAEGYGRYTQGARAGDDAPAVLHVTSLEDGTDEDKGTFRWALAQRYPRIIVFDVSGTIYLSKDIEITGQQGMVTVFGQTAPGDGICIANYPIHILADNVIIRYMRFRLGDASLIEDDAINGCPTSSKSNIVIDHCSMSWSVDECASFYNLRQFSLQWCMISESLRISVHDKGTHGYGGIWGGNTVSFHHNLLADHDSRNIRFDHDYVSTLKGPIDYINNVVYNWGGNSAYGGESANSSGNNKKINMINNYYKPGAASSHKSRLLQLTHDCPNCLSEYPGPVRPGVFYLEGNYIENAAAVNADNWKGVEDYGSEATLEAAKATAYQPTTIADYDLSQGGKSLMALHSATDAFAKVVDYAGCSYKRDVVDARVADETKNGTYGTYGKYSGTQTGEKGSKYGLIDTQEDVGGWPELKDTGALEDSDNDGIPDVWEDANGLNKNNAADAVTTSLCDKDADNVNKVKYTNIEVYANSLVEDKIKAQREGAQSSFEEYYPACEKPTAIKAVYSNEVQPEVKKVKVNRNGKITIGDYNILGQKIK